MKKPAKKKPAKKNPARKKTAKAALDRGAKAFEFSVDAAGNFSYGPPPDWKYNRFNSPIQFLSKAGPFAIRLRRIDIPPPALIKPPFGGDLHALESPPGQWVAEVTKIQHDGLTDSERTTIWTDRGGNAGGFLAKYKYLIAVSRGSQVLIDDTRNGTHEC